MRQASVEQTVAAQHVAVAIVNYRSAGMVTAGLPALLDALEGFAGSRVIIVDNASPDDGADVIAAFLTRFDRADRVRLVCSPVNGGFAAGNNLAFATLKKEGMRFDHVLLLNPDAEVARDAIRLMVATMLADPRAGVVGAALRDETGASCGAAFRFPSLMGEFALGCGLGPVARRWPVLAEIGDGPTRVDWVSGAAMLVRGVLIEALGGMDDGYFLYYEEVDFMRKATRAGWTVWHQPAAVAVHRAGASTGIVDGKAVAGRMPAWWFEAWLRYFVNNHGVVYARASAALRLVGLLIAAVAGPLRGRPQSLPPRYMADFARHCLFGPIPDRRAR